MPERHPNFHPNITVKDSETGPLLSSTGPSTILFRSALGLPSPDFVGSADLSLCGRFVAVDANYVNSSFGPAYSCIILPTQTYPSQSSFLFENTQIVSNKVVRYVFALKPEHWVAPVTLRDHFSDPVQFMGHLLNSFEYLVNSAPNSLVGFPFRTRKLWSVPLDFPRPSRFEYAETTFMSKSMQSVITGERKVPVKAQKALVRSIENKIGAFETLMADPKVQFVSLKSLDYVPSCDFKKAGSYFHKSLLQPLMADQEQATTYLIYDDTVLREEIDAGPLYGGTINVPVVSLVRFSKDLSKLIFKSKEGKESIEVNQFRLTSAYHPAALGRTESSHYANDIFCITSAFQRYLSCLFAPEAPSKASSAAHAVFEACQEHLSGPLPSFSVVMSRPLTDPENHPGQIGFYLKAEDIGKKVTWTRPGRYLARLAVGDEPWGGQQGLQKAALLLDTHLKPPVLHIAETSEDCVMVYRNGPNSCMSGTKAMVRDQHPACVYGGQADLKVAYIGYLENPKARCVVWPTKKEYGRIYGDVERMQAALEGAGYTEDGDFVGATLNLVPMSGYSGRIMMPYFDGDSSVYLDGVVLRVGRGSTEICSDNTNGWADLSRFTCDECGDRCDEDDCTTVHDGNRVCESCLDADFVYVYRSGEYHPADEVTFVNEINEWVLDNDDDLFTCEHSGNYSVGTQHTVVVSLDGDTETWSETSVENHASVVDDEWVANAIADEYQELLQEKEEAARCPSTPDLFELEAA